MGENITLGLKRSSLLAASLLR